MMTVLQRLGLGGLMVFVIVGVGGPLVVDVPAVDLARDLAPPSSSAPLGHGEIGVPLHAALLWGARGALVVGVAVTTLTTTLTVLLTWCCALGPVALRRLVLRAADLALAFPSLLLALALAALLPPSPLSVIAALSASSWAAPLQVLVPLADRAVAGDAIRSAVALGASRRRIARVHLTPLLWSTLLVQATQGFGGAVVAEASLSFLGLSSPPLAPPFYTSWGTLLDDGTALSFAAPHLWGPPALCVFFVAASAQLAVLGRR
jgi:ABC-type dipeptide/oligopeptide/nickel transport system permease subunit